LQNKLEYFAFLVFGRILRIFGLNRARKISGFIAGIFFYLIPIRKETVLENLRFAFPEKGDKEIKRTAFNVYKSFSTSLIEILLMPYLSRNQIESAVYLPEEAKSLICRKIDEGKGLILLTAHYGNWEYVAASVSAQINKTFYVIVKSQRNPYVNKWMNDARERWTNKVVPLGTSVREIFRQLRAKNVVGIVADQRGPSDGIRVNFFGRKASVYPGPAMFALKTKSPVLLGLSVRQEDNTYKVHLEEISFNDLPENEEEKIIEISRRHTAILEKYIRMHPEQWFWMHKRWKY
jgi:Kdo2-lipid IVA lauroyltransferase/acyltransferase